MPRPAAIWFRKQTGWYCTKLGGVVHKLSKDKAEARKVFYKLMGGGAVAGKAGLTAKRLLDTYLDRTRPDKSPETHAVQTRVLRSFCAALGHRDAAGVKVHEVNDWLAGTGWGQSTRNLAASVVRAGFNWAVGQGYLPASPVAALRAKKMLRRERVLTDAERAGVPGVVSGDFADFAAVLELTGCRPFSEAAKLTAAHIDWANGRAVLAEHKNAGKGKKRILYFPPALLLRLRALADSRPTGVLLRNRLGFAWARGTATRYCARAAAAIGCPPFTPYAYRHTYITNALLRGVPVEAVAELVGNSPRVIHSNYAHLAKLPDAMRAAALKAVT